MHCLVRLVLVLALAAWGLTPPVAAQGRRAAAALATGASGVPAAPEAASGFRSLEAVAARRFMIATANPHATAAGQTMLARGGSAIDAAIAAQMVLNLVEPQSSGLGGGAFLMFWDAHRRTVSAWDGRETAPATADEQLFLDASGAPLNFYDAVVGGRAVGTPGVLRLLEAVHRRHGKLRWQTLFAPAIALATRGFPVSPRLHALLADEHFLKRDPVARAYFYDEAGTARPVGHVLRNPALANTLRAIARQGARVLYDGPIGAALVARVRDHADNPGRLSTADLRSYRARQRPATCQPYRLWLVCGMPPPSSGGITVAQMLGILTHTRIADLPPRAGMPDVEAIHLFSEAGRLAYADRAKYLADADFVRLPDGLLDADYLAQRASLIGAQSLGQASAGTPRGAQLAWADDQSADVTGTTHLSIVDARGNAIAMTSSIEDGFGARLMVGGFLLNNQLTDFSFVAQDQGRPVANRVAGGKRPRSSMAPTLVFETDAHGRPARLMMSLGSSGGPTIINHVAKTLVASLDWKLDIQQAIGLMHFGSRNGPTEIERGRVPAVDEAALLEVLRGRGHAARANVQTSGMQGIQRTEGGWLGGVDPRREGLVLGQ